MATIGSISVAFEANLKGLETGIEDVIDLFDDISETVDDLSEKLDGVADKKINIKATADTKAVVRAKKEVEDLETEIEKAKPEVKVAVNREGLADLGKQFTQVITSQVKQYGEAIKEFGESTSTTAKSIGSAAKAVGDVFDGTASTIDGVIVAASRAQKAYADWGEVVKTVSGAAEVFTEFAGGGGAVLAALSGEAAAGARVLSSFGAAAAFSAASVVTYSAVMAVARVATAGMSEEARNAALGWASMGASLAAAAAGTGAANAAFAVIYESLGKSSTAAEFFGEVLERASSAASSAASSILSNLGRILNVLTLVSVASGKFTKSLEQMGGQAETIQNMSDRFGATAQEIQVLQFAAQSAGVGMGQLAKAQQAFYTNVSKIKTGQLNIDSVKEAKFAFDRLGVSVEDLRNLRPEEVFRLVGERLDGVQDAADRAAIAFDLFGKQGGNILPALRGLKDAAADASRLGTAMSGADFEMFKGVDQSFDRLKQAAGNFSKTMLVAFAPIQTGWNNLMADLTGGLVAALGPVRTAMAAATAPLQVFMEVVGRMLNILLRGVGVILQFAAAIANVTFVAPAWRALGDAIKGAMGYLEEALSYAERVASVFTSQMVPAIDAGASAFDKLVFALKIFATSIVSIGVASALMQSFGIASGISLATFAAGLKSINFAAVFGGIIKFLKLLTVDVVATAGKWVASFTLMGVTAIANFVTPFIASVATIITGNAAIATSATVTGAAMAAAWVVGTLGLALIAVGLVAIYNNFDKLYAFFADFGNNIGSLLTFEGLAEAAAAVADAIKNAFLQVFNFISGFFSRLIQNVIRGVAGVKTPEKINAASASASDIVQSRQANQRAEFQASIAAADAIGASTDSIQMPVEDVNSMTSAIEESRKKMTALSLNAAQFGEMGRKAFLEAKADFDKLQQGLANGTLSPEQFEKEAARIRRTLQDNITLADVLSPEQMQQSAEGMRKAVEDAMSKVRGIMRGRDLGSDLSTDRFFPTSDAIKKQAQDFAAAYENELIRIEETLQSGGFGDGQEALKRAQRAREQATADFERNTGKIDADVSFAAEIKKSLEDAFLSPLDKYQKRLKQIEQNQSLGFVEKAQATLVEREKMVRDVFGQSGGQSLRDRQAFLDEASKQDAAGRNAFASIEGGAAAGQARAAAEQNKLDIDRRKAAGLDATAAQQLKAGADNIADIFGVTGLSIEEIQKKLGPEKFAEYQEAIKKNADAVRASLGVEQTGAQKIAQQREKLSQAVADEIITKEEAMKAEKRMRDDLLSSLGISKSPSQEFEDAVTRIRENAEELSPTELAKGLEEAKDKLLQSLGIPESPAKQASEALKRLGEAFSKGQISAEELAKGTAVAKNALLQSLGIPLDPVVQLAQRMSDLQDAFSQRLISEEEFIRGQEEARRSMLPGSEAESPVKQFERDMETLQKALDAGVIDKPEMLDRQERLKAQLQEDLKPALDSVAPDRRLAGASDVRSRGGVDTFFRILQGRDNPSLKAQLEIKRNTAILAQAAQNPDAAPVIAQLSAR